MKASRIVSSLGVLGMLLIHSNTLPAIVGALNGGTLPPLLMTIQTVLALLLLLIHSCYYRFTLYAIGNASGLIGQTIVLFLTLKG